MNVTVIDCSELTMCEIAARASTNTIDKTGTKDGFLKGLLEKKHLKVFEFANITFNITCSISAASQIRTHRNLVVLQRSTRYVDYADKCEYELPEGMTDEQESKFIESMLSAQNYYRALKALGVPKDIRKLCIPAGYNTQMVIQASLRSWFDFIEKRSDATVHYEIREIANQIEEHIKTIYPELF